MLILRSGGLCCGKFGLFLKMQKQTANKLVETWLQQLGDLVYDVEDVLDEFATESLQRNLAEKTQASSSKVRKFMSTYWHTGSAAVFNVQKVSPIRDITARLEEILASTNILQLTEHGGRSNIPRARRSIRHGRQLETSLTDSFVCGRGEDKQAVVDMLLRGEASDAAGGLSVIPIQGMGGIGKTTLARLVYCDDQVEDFELKAWACISDTSDVCSITRMILRSIRAEICDSDDLNTLQVKLKEKVSEKKFLIVLDDVWEVEYREWTNLCKPLQAGLPGSSIIITTRDGSISSRLGTVSPYHLKEVSYDHCLSIFARHALGDRILMGTQI